MIGFMPGSGQLSVDDVTIKTDRTPGGDGVYETTELVETFTVDSGGYAEEAPTYDAAGNMTYDGIYAYSYDAWNRMVKVQKAWRTGNVPGGALNTGSVISESKYDGMGRRIVKQVKNSADLDCTYHYYYTPGGHSLIETRNGSNATLKQNTWGLTYIDELVRVDINDDPADSSERVCETGYYALQDANFNVVALAGQHKGVGSLCFLSRTPHTAFALAWTHQCGDGSGFCEGRADTRFQRQEKTAVRLMPSFTVLTASATTLE